MSNNQLPERKPSGPRPVTIRDEAQRNIYSKRIDGMEANELRQYVEDLRTALLTDERTGLGSNRAWITRTPKAFIASIDLDSLKFVNDNMGHDAGDRMIAMMGEALRQAGIEGDSYHVSGDEFYAQADTRERLEQAMAEARKWLSEQSITTVGATLHGPGFSYGIGSNITEAEDKLHEQKHARELSGERAARGERPRGFSKAAESNVRGGVEKGSQEAAGDRPGRRDERSRPQLGEFESYSDALEWIDQRTKALGMSRRAFSSTDEYKAAYPQIDALYRAEKAKKAENARQLLMKAGLAPGDTVTTTALSMFGGADTYTGQIFLKGGTPYVRVDGRITVSKNGRLRDTSQVRWDSRWTKLESDLSASPKVAATEMEPLALDLDPAPTISRESSPFDSNKIFTADKARAASARLKAKCESLNSEFAPEILVEGLPIAGAYIEAGINDFRVFSESMMVEFGPSIQPYLPSFWEGARHYPGINHRLSQDASISTPPAPAVNVDTLKLESALDKATTLRTPSASPSR